jgi:hypothetical protein
MNKVSASINKVSIMIIKGKRKYQMLMCDPKTNKAIKTMINVSSMLTKLVNVTVSGSITRGKYIFFIRLLLVVMIVVLC